MFYESSVDFVLDHAGDAGDRVAVADNRGRRLTFSELLTAASRTAERLLGIRGVEPGAKIAIALENTVDSAVALFGLWMASTTVVVIDPLSFREDLVQQLEMSKPALFLVEDHSADRLCEYSRPASVNCVKLSSIVSRERRPAWEGYHRPRAWDNALIYFYAGIAGRTLETIHTHSTLAASAIITRAHHGIESSDVLLVTPPLSHALGLQVSLLTAIASGAEAYLYFREKKLDPTQLAADISAAKPTIIIGAPALYSALLDAGYRGSPRLRFSISAGAPLPPRVQEGWRTATHTPLLQLYGMTEAAPVSATTPEDNPVGSIGKPMPGIEIRIVDPDNPSRRAETGPGELLVRGPVVMKGYSDPDETRRAFIDGWLRTGDIIEVKDGNLYFRGVRKRMLKYKGYPVFPRDLEILLEKHPAVRKARVYGEDAGEVGQIPVAEVWLEPGASVSEEELLKWVNERVAPYKKLRKIIVHR